MAEKVGVAGSQGQSPSEQWRDELVELHVLAQNGDASATETAARWCATDPAARHTWDAVERACDLVLEHRQPVPEHP